MFKRLALSAMVVLGLWVGQGRAGEPATGPSLGTGLSGIADWSTEQPFLDLMKAARPWVASTPAQWGAWDYGALVAGGYLSLEGWPRELPPGAQRFESIVLADQPEAAGSLAGTYVLRWEGDAEVGIYGRAVGLALRLKKMSVPVVNALALTLRLRRSASSSVWMRTSSKRSPRADSMLARVPASRVAPLPRFA